MERSSRIFGVALLVAACSAAHLAAAGAAENVAREAPTFLCKEWRAEDGLPQAHIYSLAQTRDGYLWLGTPQVGPVRYDGIRFVPLSELSPDYAARFARGRWVSAMVGGSDGSLWLALEGGLVRWRGGRLAVYTTAEGLPSNSVRALRESPDGSLWVGTASGIARVRLDAVERGGAADGLRGRDVTALWEDSDGSLWAGTQGRGLFRLRDGRWESFRAGDGLLDDSITALLRDRLGRLWVGTRGGLNRLDGDRFVPLGEAEGLPEGGVLALGEDRHGDVWVGTTAGVRYLSGGVFTPIPTAARLTDQDTSAILADREGSVWLGTDAGLIQARPRLVSVLGTDAGLTHPHVMAACEGPGGALWVATAAAGLNFYRDGTLSGVAAEGLSHAWTTAVCDDGDGGAWVGTWGKGLNHVGRDGDVTIYSTREGLPGNTIKALYHDRKGGLWVATNGRGLCRIVDGRVAAVPGEGIAADAAVILEDRAGRIWVGTGHGLGRSEAGGFVNLTEEDGLPCDSILSLHETDDGTLWVGTEWGGLARYKGGSFAGISARDGLPSDTVTQILEDGRANLWMGSPRGVFRASRRQLDDFAEGRSPGVACASFGRADGMISSQCSTGSPAGCRASDGRLYFPTDAGLAVIDPGRLDDGRPPPLAVIEKVLVDGEAPDEGRRPAAGRGNVEFRFTACSFVNPQEVRFQHKLEGFDPSWVDAGTRRVVGYANLPPGRYRFRVRSRNDGGAWGEGEAAEVVLPPHYYQEPWFRASCAAAAVLLLGGAYRVRVARLRARERELVRLVELRTAELVFAKADLEAQNVRLSELAVTDPLTGLKNRRWFFESLRSTLQQGGRRGQPTSVVMLDVDHFKAYNDSFGHTAGDEVLHRLGVLLSAATRVDDVVSRLGGEEFAVLLPNADADRALAFAERLRGAIAAHDWPRRPVTVSLGVATAVEGGPELVDGADRALYRAKRLGRDRAIHFRDLQANEPGTPPATGGRGPDAECPAGLSADARTRLAFPPDDDRTSRDAGGRTPAGSGFRAATATAGAEALQHAACGADLIVLDVSLSGIDGLEVCRRLKADPATAAIPVLHLSPHFVRGRDRASGPGLGAHAPLPQPVEPEDLVAAARALLRASDVEEALRRSRDELDEAVRTRTADLERSYDSTIEVLARALELRDQETEGHSRRVAEMTIRLARALGVDEASLVAIRRGALLHDIGKIGIPDRVLLKPGALDDEERAVMRRHPAYAAELLGPIDFLRPALEIPLCHHERWDGTGYPGGLKGEEIPLSARIFAVADVWDALSRDRYYRRAWPEAKVREHLRSLAGTHLEPRIVAVFLDVVLGVEAVPGAGRSTGNPRGPA